jgi:hypothetical protein
MFKCQLEFEDGTPAGPATFVAATPTWHAGDMVLIRPGFEFVIVLVETRATSRVLFRRPRSRRPERRPLRRRGGTRMDAKLPEDVFEMLAHSVRRNV